MRSDEFDECFEALGGITVFEMGMLTGLGSITIGGVEHNLIVSDGDGVDVVGGGMDA